jgi:hypothetical protein
MISTRDLTAHIPGGNYLLNKIILLVIKISLTDDQDTPVNSTRKIDHLQARRDLFTYQFDTNSNKK